MQSPFNGNIYCLVLDEITGYIPEDKVDTNQIMISENIRLADPSYGQPDKVDLLIGVELFYNLLSVGQIRLNQSGLVLQKTKLGWVFGDPIKGNFSETS